MTYMLFFWFVLKIILFVDWFSIVFLMLVVVIDFLILVEVVEVVGEVTHRDEGDVDVVAPMNSIKQNTLAADGKGNPAADSVAWSNRK